MVAGDDKFDWKRWKQGVLNAFSWPSARQYARNGAVLGVAFVALYLLGGYLPEGFDWVEFFSKGHYPSFWMPWTKHIVALLDYPSIFAITVMALALRAYRYRPSPLALLLCFLSLPTLWMFFLGNLDGLVSLGLITLPLGAPLVLVKPQVAGYALLARKSSLMAGGVWLLISFAIWGFWPVNMLEVFTPEWNQEWVQDITLFPWGLLVALPLMWFSRGDEDLLMAAGSFASPHLFPYHFMVLMPALARMRRPWMVTTWAVSFLPLLANWLGPWAWHFGNLMGVCFWVGVYTNRKSPNLAAPSEEAGA